MTMALALVVAAVASGVLVVSAGAALVALVMGSLVAVGVVWVVDGLKGLRHG